MKKVLIDKFVVPEESKAAFLDGTHKVQGFLRTLPGFVEGFLSERKDGQSRYNFLTTAVWENEQAFENAKKAVAIDFKNEASTPKKETRRQLKIESVRSIYERSPY